MSTVCHAIVSDEGDFEIVVQHRNDGDPLDYHRKWMSRAEYDACMSDQARIQSIRDAVLFDSAVLSGIRADDVIWLCEIAEKARR